MTQALPLREQMKSLEHLQELDLKIDSLKKKKAALPTSLKTLDDQFNKVRLSLEAKKNAIAEIEKAQRQTEAAMELNRDRLTRANSKLESVANSQEFQAANREIDQLKKLNGSLEEQLKKAKADLEAGGKDIDALNGDFSKVQEARSAQAGVVEKETGQIDSEIQVLMAERGKYTGQINLRTLALYDRVRVARGGVGFVPAVGGRCSGCNMMVPPQLFNQVQKAAEVHSCPSCHRILFVPQAASQGAVG